MDELQAQINEALRLAFLEGVEWAVNNLDKETVDIEQAAKEYVESVNE